MRIPSNSTFTKELSKRFNIIFNKDMPLCGLTTTIGKQHGQEATQVATTIRQSNNERKEVVTETSCNQGEKKSSGLEITSS
jgi:fatty acid/phospholipid biosynthesis enzyme